MYRKLENITKTQEITQIPDIIKTQDITSQNTKPIIWVHDSHTLHIRIFERCGFEVVRNKNTWTDRRRWSVMCRAGLTRVGALSQMSKKGLSL